VAARKSGPIVPLLKAWLDQVRIVEIDFSEGCMVVTFEGEPVFFRDGFFRPIVGLRLEDSDNEWGLRYDELSGYAVRGLQAIVTYTIVSASIEPVFEPVLQPGGGAAFIRNPRNVTVLYRAGGDLWSHTFV